MNFFSDFDVKLMSGPAIDGPKVLGAEPGMAARLTDNETAPVN